MWTFPIIELNLWFISIDPDGLPCRDVSEMCEKKFLALIYFYTVLQ